MEAPRDQSLFNKELLNFLETSPTPFHAVNQITAAIGKCWVLVLTRGRSLENGAGRTLFHNEKRLIGGRLDHASARPTSRSRISYGRGPH